MAEPNKWIIISKVDPGLAWNNMTGWGDLGSASKFRSKDFLLPMGGKWVPWATNPNYDWSEGDLVTL